MPRIGRPLEYSAFYGSLQTGRTECPRCNHLILWGPGCAHRQSYDQITQRLTCPGCKQAYVLGQVLYDAPRGRQVAPSDTIPNLRILAELRTYARGLWAADQREKVDPVNLYLEGECCCYPMGWRVECPIHGGQLGHRRAPERIEDENGETIEERLARTGEEGKKQKRERWKKWKEQREKAAKEGKD